MECVKIRDGNTGYFEYSFNCDEGIFSSENNKKKDRHVRNIIIIVIIIMMMMMMIPPHLHIVFHMSLLTHLFIHSFTHDDILDDVRQYIIFIMIITTCVYVRK